MSQQGLVEVQILVDRAVLERDKDAVVAELEDVGLRVDRVLFSLGIVLGVTPAKKIDDLRHVPGVLGVEKNREVRTAV